MNQENASLRPKRLVARTDNKKMYLTLGLSVIAIGALYFFVSRFEMVVWVATVIIIGAGGIREALRGKTRVIIDERGVLDNRLGLGTIRWRDISKVYVARNYNIAHVCLEVENSKHYLSRRWAITNLLLKYRARQTKIPLLSINTGVLDAEAGEIYEAIIANWEFYSERK